MHALLRLLAPRHPPHALSSLAASFPRYFRNPKMINSCSRQPHGPNLRRLSTHQRTLVFDPSLAFLTCFSGITISMPRASSSRRQLEASLSQYLALHTKLSKIRTALLKADQQAYACDNSILTAPPALTRALISISFRRLFQHFQTIFSGISTQPKTQGHPMKFSLFCASWGAPSRFLEHFEVRPRPKGLPC